MYVCSTEQRLWFIAAAAAAAARFPITAAAEARRRPATNTSQSNSQRTDHRIVRSIIAFPSTPLHSIPLQTPLPRRAAPHSTVSSPPSPSLELEGIIACQPPAPWSPGPGLASRWVEAPFRVRLLPACLLAFRFAGMARTSRLSLQVRGADNNHSPRLTSPHLTFAFQINPPLLPPPPDATSFPAMVWNRRTRRLRRWSGVQCSDRSSGPGGGLFPARGFTIPSPRGSLVLGRAVGDRRSGHGRVGSGEGGLVW